MVRLRRLRAPATHRLRVGLFTAGCLCALLGASSPLAGQVPGPLPATKQPPTKQPATQQPATKQPATKQPATKQPATKQPATKQPATQQPATKQPATKQPATKQPVTKQPEAKPAEAKLPDATRPDTPAQSTTEPDRPVEQLRCPPDVCTEIAFNPENATKKLDEAMAKGAGMILLNMEDWALPFKDDRLQPLNRYLHGVADRGGRVVLEPVYIKTRGSLKLPVVKDVLSTGYDVASRAYAMWKYRRTGNYHAKVLYRPGKRYVTYVYFIHRNFGDICVTLKSRCNVIEYTDSDTFDLVLSKQLEQAQREGKEVRVIFPEKKVVLPEARLSLQALTDAGDALRIYKWMAASGEVEKRSMVRKRFVGIQAVTTAIDLGLKAYDLVKAYLMYKPARTMKAEVQVSPTERGNEVSVIIFTPSGRAPEESSCLF